MGVIDAEYFIFLIPPFERKKAHGFHSTRFYAIILRARLLRPLPAGIISNFFLSHLPQTAATHLHIFP